MAPARQCDSQPRSGDRSVAHGVSHGVKRVTQITQPGGAKYHRDGAAAPRPLQIPIYQGWAD